MVKENVNIQVRKVRLIHRLFNNSNSSRTIDLQLPDGGNSSRRSSNGSDTESRLASGKFLIPLLNKFDEIIIKLSIEQKSLSLIFSLHL